MSHRVVALAGALVQWEVLTGFHTIELTATVYGMYEVNTCSRRDSPRWESLTPLQQAAASLRLVVIPVIAHHCYALQVGMYAVINIDLSVCGNLLVFPINFSKYKSFCDVVLGQLDKAYLVL